MEKAAWHFKKLTPDNMKNRNAMQEKFFELDKGMVVSLVRESIQNSLDAKDPDSRGPVDIRVLISGQEKALSRSAIETFLTDEAWEHYAAKGNGLDAICPERDELCHYIVIEDFGTRGLNGDILEWSKPEESQNNFYHFFRAEGESDKGLTAASRGKHGVGKIVFPMTSRLKTFFGLTVRKEDDMKYLVGQCVLKHHKVNGTPYTPDGWFGHLSGENLPMPIDDESGHDIITEFSNTFSLRRSSENGLSVIIPYVSEEIDDYAIVRAIVEDYFWAILKEELVITITSPREEWCVEKGSLANIVSGMELDEEIGAKIELAKWATETGLGEIVTVNAPKSTGPPKWSEELIEPELRVQLRRKLEAEEKIAIRVPLSIRKKEGDGQGQATYYDVFLQRSKEGKSGRPVFIREGIIIPNASRDKCPGTLALITADHLVIATFLGDAEGPAHTEWSANAKEFKGEYMYGPDMLTFVKKTVSGIISVLDESSKQEDRTLLADFFSIPMPSDGPKRPSTKHKDKDPDKTEEPKLDIESKPKRFKVTRVQGGFTISSAERPVSVPATLDMKLFYDRHGGKARYSPHDFKLNEPPIKVSGRNVEVKSYKDNQLKIEINDSDFSLTVKGFDTNRDLYVRPRIVEQEDENATV
jgi:hypothetical protein